MRGLAPLARLNRVRISIQLPLVLASIPLAASIWGWALVPVGVSAAVDDEPIAVAEMFVSAIRTVLALDVLAVALSAFGAGLLLRGSLRSAVDEVAAATHAIAHGDFSHRVHSSRRDELGRVARSVDAMAERLELLEASRRELLASVSHELRTPLTVIRGAAYTLARHESRPQVRDRLGVIEQQTCQLARIVEELVDAAAIQAGAMRLELATVNLAALVRRVGATYQSMADQVGVDLDVRAYRCDDVTVDRDRIEQVLGNLLTNAMRHAAPGSLVLLHAQGACVRVVNCGEPIDSATATHLFRPFEQAGGNVGRLGLGLSIARGIAAAHGASLSLDTTHAERGDVRFLLDLAAARAVEDAA